MHMYTGEMYRKGCIDSFDTSDFNSTLLKHHFIRLGIVSRCVHGVISRNKINNKLIVLIIGASLSEPHIDGDVRPTSRGMFVCIWPRGAFVRLQCSREHAYSINNNT